MENDMKNWRGIMKIDEIIHNDNNGNVLFKEENIYNILHNEGEEQILSAVFTGGSTNNSFIPANYFLGLDNRTIVTATQTLANLSGEPSGSGYSRQPSSSTTGFTIINTGGVYQAKSNIVIFAAITGSWGPVINLFLTDVSSGTSGNLYSTAVLSSPIILSSGETISVRFSMALKNC
jgi:hypothetical protein